MPLPPMPAALAAAASPSVANDRGAIYQLLTALGVGTSTAHELQVYSVGPLRIILVLAIAFSLTRLVGRVSARLIGSLRLFSPVVRATVRGEDRAETLAGVFTSLLKGLIWIVAALTVLGELHVSLAPFVATATVVGAAVGFGAQSLVKDFLSGVLILAEDQYGVGDSITVTATGTSGVVEGVNLRTTRLRALDGTVWYVPNGDIRAVGNSSEETTVALVDVAIPHTTDLEAAGVAAEAACRQVAAGPALTDKVLSPPTFVAVVASDTETATIRVVARTAPGAHVEVGRQLRMAILERLRADGLAWAPVVTAAPVADTPPSPAGGARPGG